MAPATPGVSPRIHQFSDRALPERRISSLKGDVLAKAPFLANDGAKGHRLDSRPRESSRTRLLTVESQLLRCPHSKENARACALSSSLPYRTRNLRTGWRRGGDSNPRDPFESTRVPGVRLKPGSATSPRACDYASHQRAGPVREAAHPGCA